MMFSNEVWDLIDSVKEIEVNVTSYAAKMPIKKLATAMTRPVRCGGLDYKGGDVEQEKNECGNE